MTPTGHRRIVLHIGQTKAGSTAIQNYLEGQRSALANQGILFPSSGFSRGNPFDQERTSGHLSMVRSIAAGKTSELEQELSKAKADTLLISAENLFLDRPIKELEALRKFFVCDQIEILLVLRDPLDWVKSIYSEEVLSGFFCRTDTFEEFLEDKLRAGSLEYAERIAYLDAVLQPKTWHVVNYNAAPREEGVIGAFLSAAGIPWTDANLVASLRANVREKEAFLIEGKRRLNYALSCLPMDIKLQLEKLLREASKSISASLSKSVPLFSDSPVPLSVTACNAIQASNTKIVQQYGLSDALPDPSPCSGKPNWRGLEGTSELVTFGLKAASKLSRAIPADDQLPELASANSNPLCVQGSSLIVELLERVTVSWHIASPQTPIWAAAYPGKLPIMIAGALNLTEYKQLLSMELPSHVICLETLEMLIKIMPQRTPEALVVSPLASLDAIKKAWCASGGSSILALIGHDRDAVSIIETQLSLKVQNSDGCTYLLGATEC